MKRNDIRAVAKCLTTLILLGLFTFCLVPVPATRNVLEVLLLLVGGFTAHRMDRLLHGAAPRPEEPAREPETVRERAA